MSFHRVEILSRRAIDVGTLACKFIVSNLLKLRLISTFNNTTGPIMKSLLRYAIIMSFLVIGGVMADTVPYNQATFDKLQQEGKPILVDVHADWCPTCRAQAPLIESLLKQKNFQGVASLRVDFDNQKEIVRSFRVYRQSTLIVFKGGKEVGRSLGDTSRDGIERLLHKTL